MGISCTASAQSAPKVDAVVIDNFEEFKKSVAPLINEMGAKKVVGLGEGTHGTAEFYQLRFWISRILIKEKGFRNVAFENDLSDVWFLNQQLASSNDVGGLMKNHLMSIWQNQETRLFLEWIRAYNSKHKEKVTVSGIDFPLLKPDVDLLLSLLDQAADTTLKFSVAKMSKAAATQDEAWIGMNNKAYKADMKLLRAGSKKGYVIADSIEKQIVKANLPEEIKHHLQLAIANVKQGFAPFHSAVSEGDRDSIMAHNASLMLKDPQDKMIIWAHNAHLGKAKIYNGAVGGTGGYLLKLFPNNYFVLGTGTANGTFAGTLDVRPTNSNPMIKNTLEKPIEGSWEAMWSEIGTNFYFKPEKFNPNKTIKPLRFIGFGTKSGASSYDQVNLVDLFDAFLFIRNSNAPTPLE